METTRELTVDLRPIYMPHARQALAHKCPALLTLFGGAVGGGKTWWLCGEGLQLSIEYPGNRGYLCRHEYRSFRRTTLLTLEKMLPLELIEQHHQTDHYFRLLNGSEIWYGGLGDDVKAIKRLRTMELGWFGIEQAEETTEEHFLWLATRLRHKLLDGSSPHYRGLLTGNPDPGWTRNRFIEQSLPDHEFIPSLPTDNPYLPPGYIDSLREILPKDMADALIRGDWDVVMGTDYLIPFRDVNMAVARELEPGEDDIKAFGIDVARFGDDKTVVFYRHGPVIRQIWQWGKMDLEQTKERVVSLIEQHQPKLVIVDAIGVGAGLHDSLRHKPDWKVDEESGWKKPILIEFKASEAARDSEHYVNQRAEQYSGLAKRLEEGQLDIPDDRELKSQLAGLRYEFNSRSQIQVESKEKMKKRGLPSPDKADALVLSFVKRRRAIWV